MKRLLLAIAVFFLLIGAAFHRCSIAADIVPTTRPTPDLGKGADLHGARLFSDDDPWNTDITKAPIDPASNDLIQTVGPDTELHPDFGPKGGGIPYVVVCRDQKKVPIQFENYGKESDPGPYPVPPDAPIETGNDGHVLVLDRDAWILYELYRGHPAGDGWQARGGAIFDLRKPSNQRPAGWTSCDGAGLAILPGLVRYDEVMGRKKIEHALRFTVENSRRAYVPPARHWCSYSFDPKLPPMGMRVRLKADYDISGFPPPVQVILAALKKYGMMLADEGGDWYITGAPDPRWDNDLMHALARVKGRDLEVVKMEGIVVDRK